MVFPIFLHFALFYVTHLECFVLIFSQHIANGRWVRIFFSFVRKVNMEIETLINLVLERPTLWDQNTINTAIQQC